MTRKWPSRSAARSCPACRDRGRLACPWTRADGLHVVIGVEATSIYPEVEHYAQPLDRDTTHLDFT